MRRVYYTIEGTEIGTIAGLAMLGGMFAGLALIAGALWFAIGDERLAAAAAVSLASALLMGGAAAYNMFRIHSEHRFD